MVLLLTAVLSSEFVGLTSSPDSLTALDLGAHTAVVKVLTALVACLLGLVVALVAGILTKRFTPWNAAVAAGGGAFVATVLLCLALFSYVMP